MKVRRKDSDIEKNVRKVTRNSKILKNKSNDRDRNLRDGIYIHRGVFVEVIESALFQVKVWFGTGNNPLPAPMMTQFTDAWMCQGPQLTRFCPDQDGSDIAHGYTKNDFLNEIIYFTLGIVSRCLCVINQKNCWKYGSALEHHGHQWWSMNTIIDDNLPRACVTEKLPC